MSCLQLLEGTTPGKVGGSPGNAFELVYTVVTDAVRDKMHAVDPVLAEYIRRATIPQEVLKPPDTFKILGVP